MVDQADSKFSKRILWFGLAVVAILVVIALVKVNALHVSTTDPKPLPSGTIVNEKKLEKDSIPAEDVNKPLLENTGLMEKSNQPNLLDNQFGIKRILEFNEPFVHGFWIWDDKGVPEGEIVITVDLKAESMSVFRDGYEIGAAVISFGDALKPTPTGVFPITQKSKDHISNIYGTPMPYMLRMTNDGISIHGANVRWGWGTRGCIGVPTEFAAKLFEQVKLGDRVIVTDGKMLQVG